MRNIIVKVHPSKANLKKKGINASNSLSRSFKSSYKVSPNSIEASISAEDYLPFIDSGVKGVKGGKSLKGFKYTNKMPPPSKLDKWIVRKGIAPRNKGKFQSRKSLQFAIAKSIYKKGIKPSMFFTKPFVSAFKRLPDDLLEAYAIGLEKQIQLNIDKK